MIPDRTGHPRVLSPFSIHYSRFGGVTETCPTVLGRWFLCCGWFLLTQINSITVSFWGKFGNVNTGSGGFGIQRFGLCSYNHAAVITSLSHVGRRALTGSKTTRHLQCGHLTPLIASANTDLLNAQYLFVPLFSSLHRNVCCKMGAMMSMNV